MMIYDATDMILGRVATYAAKKAMLGEDVIVINCKDAMVSGKRPVVFAHYKQRYDRGTHTTGPFYPRYPELIMKRTIRGMFPMDRQKGRDAFKRVRCYRAVPAELKGKETVALQGSSFTKLPTLKVVRLSEISKHLGAKL